MERICKREEWKGRKEKGMERKVRERNIEMICKKKEHGKEGRKKEHGKDM